MTVKKDKNINVTTTTRVVNYTNSMSQRVTVDPKEVLPTNLGCEDIQSKLTMLSFVTSYMHQHLALSPSFRHVVMESSKFESESNTKHLKGKEHNDDDDDDDDRGVHTHVSRWCRKDDAIIMLLSNGRYQVVSQLIIL